MCEHLQSLLAVPVSFFVDKVNDKLVKKGV